MPTNSYKPLWDAKRPGIRGYSHTCTNAAPTQGCTLSHSVVSDFATPMHCRLLCPPGKTLSVEFSRQEYWSGLLFPTPGNLSDPWTEPSCFARGTLHHHTNWETPHKGKHILTQTQNRTYSTQHIPLKVTQETHTHGNIYPCPLPIPHTHTILKYGKSHSPGAEVPTQAQGHTQRETDPIMKTNHGPTLPAQNTHLREAYTDTGSGP